MKKSLLILITLCLNLFAINIGVVLPISGATSNYGEYSMRGLEIAQSLNPVTLSGEKINLIYADSKGSKTEAGLAVERLIQQFKVVAIIGEVSSSNSIVVANVCEKYGIPMLTPTATNTMITNNKKYVSRACFDDDFQGYALAKYVNKTIDKVVIITDIGQSYSVGLTKAFKNNFKGSYREFNINTGDVDFSHIVLNLKPTDVVFFSGYYKELALLVRKMSSLDMNNVIVGGDAIGFSDIYTIGGKASDNVYFSAQFNPEGATNIFITEYLKKYKDEPETFSALSYDAYNIMLHAINRCATVTSTCINTGIHTLDNYIGVSGAITIDINGNAKKDVIINKFNSGKITLIDTIPKEKI